MLVLDYSLFAENSLEIYDKEAKQGQRNRGGHKKHASRGFWLYIYKLLEKCYI